MRDHHTAYDHFATDRCERALLTLLGDVGPWNKRIYLAGGLAPRYLVGRLPDGSPPHVGTTDVDLIGRCRVVVHCILKYRPIGKKAEGRVVRIS